MTRMGKHVLNTKILSSQFLKATATGRVAHHCVDLGTNNIFSILTLYGWTNAHEHSDQAARTNSIIEAILEEMTLQPRLPTIIATDLNGDLVELPTKEDFRRYGFVMENQAGEVCMPSLRMS